MKVKIRIVGPSRDEGKIAFDLEERLPLILGRSTPQIDFDHSSVKAAHCSLFTESGRLSFCAIEDAPLELNRDQCLSGEITEGDTLHMGAFAIEFLSIERMATPFATESLKPSLPPIPERTEQIFRPARIVHSAGNMRRAVSSLALMGAAVVSVAAWNHFKKSPSYTESAGATQDHAIQDPIARNSATVDSSATPPPMLETPVLEAPAPRESVAPKVPRKVRDFFYAVWKGDLASVQKLHSKSGVGLNSVVPKYGLPLCVAAMEGRLKVMAYLISKGAQVNALDENGRTALFHAAKGNRPESARYLLSKGASSTVRDSYGYVASDYAKLSGAKSKIYLTLTAHSQRKIASKDKPAKASRKRAR